MKASPEVGSPLCLACKVSYKNIYMVRGERLQAYLSLLMSLGSKCKLL